MGGKMCGMFRENVVMPTAKGKLAKQRRKAPSSIYIFLFRFMGIYTTICSTKIYLTFLATSNGNNVLKKKEKVQTHKKN